MDYNIIIEKIVNLVGGINNIKKHTSCITRLRISVKDLKKVNIEELKNLEGTLGLNINENELQIIFGPGKVTKAREVMDSYMKEHIGEQSSNDESFEDTIKNQKENVKGKRNKKLSEFMSKFANIFVPLIPGFIAAGTMAGIAGLLQAILGTSLASNLGQDQILMIKEIIAYLNVFNKSLSSFLFIIVGYNAISSYGGTGIIGAILAGIFLLGYGDVGGEGVKFGGLIDSGMDNFFGVIIDPRGGLIGVLITCILAAYLEKLIRKKFSIESIDIITTPILTLLIMSSFAFLIIMPISSMLFDLMSYLFKTLNANPIGAGLLSALFLPAVMMGIHQGFVPVYQSLVETTGINSLFPILAMAGASQVGTCLALYLRAKKGTKIRDNIKGSILPGFLGIGEPLIYGVTLPRVKPFITSMIGAGIGGIYIGILAMFGFDFGLNTVFGASGLLGLFAMTTPSGNIVLGMLLYLSALIVSYIAGFIITYLFGYKNIDLS